MHGIPHFALSIGLERDGQLVSGVIYNPMSPMKCTRREKGGERLS